MARLPFNYLGTVLSTRASFIHAVRTLVAKCLSAKSSSLHVTNQLHIPIATMFNHFDVYGTSVLNYGYKIWCFTTYESIKRVHSKFCKYLLHVTIDNELICTIR